MSTFQKLSINMKTENITYCDSQEDIQNLSYKLKNLDLGTAKSSLKFKTLETSETSRDDRHNVQCEVVFITTRNLTQLTKSDISLISRGPSPKATGQWKKTRHSPVPNTSNRNTNRFSSGPEFRADFLSGIKELNPSTLLHFSGGSILPNTSFTNDKNNFHYNTQSSKNVSILIGGTSNPSPLQCPYESSVSLVPSISNELGSEGINTFPNLFPSPVNSPQEFSTISDISSSPPNKTYFINPDCVTSNESQTPIFSINESRSGGFNPCPDLFPSPASSPEELSESSNICDISISSPDKTCIGTSELIASNESSGSLSSKIDSESGRTDFYDLTLSLPDKTLVAPELITSNTSSENEKINQLKAMLKSPSVLPRIQPLEDINERWHDITEYIHEEVTRPPPLDKQMANPSNFSTVLVQNHKSNLIMVYFPVISLLVEGNQKKCPVILPKTDIPRQDKSSQMKVSRNTNTSSGKISTRNNQSDFPARENFKKILDNKIKGDYIKSILQETPKGESFIKMDPETGMTNLHSSIIENNKEKTYVLSELSKHPKEKWIQDIEKPDKQGKTSLYYAAYYNHPLLVSYFVECGADPLHKDELGNTALHGIAGLGDTHDEVVRILCSASAHAVNIKNNKGRIPLHCAVQYYEENTKYNGDFKAILTLLNYLSNLSSQDSTGRTPLHWALHSKSPQLVKILCENAHDTKIAINVQDVHGRSALHEAASLIDISKEVKTKIIAVLLEYNASLSIKDYKQQRPSDLLSTVITADQRYLH